MLKTMSAEERKERYIKRNPRVVKPFTREDARKTGAEQVGMHASK